MGNALEYCIKAAYRCIGIQVTTHVFNLELKLTLRAIICTFEGKVFKKMGNTVRLIRFCPATSIYPYSTGSGLGIRRIFSRNLVI